MMNQRENKKFCPSKPSYGLASWLFPHHAAVRMVSPQQDLMALAVQWNRRVPKELLARLSSACETSDSQEGREAELVICMN